MHHASPEDYDLNNLGYMQYSLVLYILLYSGIRAGSAGNDDGNSGLGVCRLAAFVFY